MKEQSEEQSELKQPRPTNSQVLGEMEAQSSDFTSDHLCVSDLANQFELVTKQTGLTSQEAKKGTWNVMKTLYKHSLLVPVNTKVGLSNQTLHLLSRVHFFLD